jgi:hypothetical protein
MDQVVEACVHTSSTIPIELVRGHAANEVCNPAFTGQHSEHVLRVGELMQPDLDL